MTLTMWLDIALIGVIVLNIISNRLTRKEYAALQQRVETMTKDISKGN